MRPIVASTALALLHAGCWLLACATPVAAAASIQVKIPPPPPGFVYDGADLLPTTERTKLERRLQVLDREGIEIGVALIASLQGDPIEDVSIAFAEAWKPGNAERDDGALILVAVEDRKMRIEVGYGLEGRVTDAAAGRIIRNRMAPAFRRGDYAGGVANAVEAIAALAKGEAVPDDTRGTGEGFDWAALIAILIGLGILYLNIRYRGSSIWISSAGWGQGRGSSRGGGGFSGGGFGGGSFGGGGSSGRW